MTITDLPLSLAHELGDWVIFTLTDLVNTQTFFLHWSNDEAWELFCLFGQDEKEGCACAKNHDAIRSITPRQKEILRDLIEIYEHGHFSADDRDKILTALNPLI